MANIVAVDPTFHRSALLHPKKYTFCLEYLSFKSLLRAQQQWDTFIPVIPQNWQYH